MSTAPLTFGSLFARLAEAITERHLTQREAADELGVSLRTLQMWLTDEQIVPRARHRRAIVAWLEKGAA